MNRNQIVEEAERLQEKLVNIRRELHQYPELGSEISHTISYVREKLEQTGIETYCSKESGLFGIIRGKKSSPCILLRADMDALPISEETGATYSSKCKGRMHACGHDAHTTWLLGAAELLMMHKDELQGTVKLAFQPCEEGKGSPGAKEMIRGGILENPKVDAAIAVHVSPECPVGRYSISSGGVTSTPCIFEINIEGKGGHGAEPWKCSDPILIMNRIYTDIQSIQRTLLSPKDRSVVSVTSMHAGNAFNVIPDTGNMLGTIRTYSKKDAQILAEKIGRIARSAAELENAKADFRYEIPIGSCINDPETANLVENTVVECFGAEAVEREAHLFTGGDDFSYFTEAVPSCYFFAGVRNERKNCVYPIHNCKFDLDESCLYKTSAILAQLALNYTEKTDKR